MHVVCHALFVLLISVVSVVCACPCSNPSYCSRITDKRDREVFIYRTDAKLPVSSYPLDVVTTIVLFTPMDNSVMCTAHESGVRVVKGTSFRADQLANNTARSLWVAQLVSDVSENWIDGVNVDFEDPVDSSSQSLLTSLMKELRQEFDSKVPGCQLSFAVAWSPNCIDGRCYDYGALGNIMDLLFLMEYDMQSQIFPSRPCLAYANSPLDWISQAVLEYTQLGVDPNRLVLGVPWYGYHYECQPGSTANTCLISHVPFRGVNCSDAAGSQWSYARIVDMLANNPYTVEWDNDAQSPYFSYTTSGGATWNMVRFDNIRSLKLKYALARSFNLRGVGMWNADLLDYANGTQVSEMWNAIKDS